MGPNENYKKILERCKVIIERDYATCGLGDSIKERLLVLTLEWEGRKEKASKEGKTIGGLGIIFYDILRAVWQAKSNEKRWGKPKCYYLRHGLQIQPSEHGGLGYWSRSMWE